MTHYQQFVQSRTKPGADIAAAMTPERAHRMHMLTALVGEILEFILADTPENEIEELGDWAFCIVGSGYDIEALWERTTYTGRIHDWKNDLTKIAEYILTFNKKEWAYNKPPTDFEPFIVELVAFMRHCQPNLQLILAANEAKLTKRYATGYSDKAAQERADKKGDGETHASLCATLKAEHDRCEKLLESHVEGSPDALSLMRKLATAAEAYKEGDAAKMFLAIKELQAYN